MRSRTERLIGHIGTETRPKLLRETGNELSVMVPYQKAPANYVPAAAVIRRGRALSGFIGRKACVGGLLSLRLKPGAQLR